MKLNTTQAIEERFFRFIKQHDMLPETAATGTARRRKGTEPTRIGIGVSGGPDSVCLAVLLKRYRSQLRLDPVVIHVNHHLRPAEAERDEQFVKELSDGYLDFAFVKYDITMGADELKGQSLEAVARDKRYAVFENCRTSLKLDSIALAHTMNDNAETVLMNILRGTGITGFSGIPPRRDHFIRPLLSLSRDNVLTYLKLNKIGYMLDSTNETPDHLRNRIRHETIPGLMEMNPGFLNHVLALSGDLREIDRLLDTISLQAYHDSLAGKDHDLISFHLKKLLSYNTIIIEKILQTAIRSLFDTHYNPRREYIGSIMDMLSDKQDNSRLLDLFPGSLKVYKNKDRLIFDRTGSR